MPLFRKVLIANRGEIALRIIRTLREMDIPSVAVFSEADRDARFAQEADESYFLGPAPAAESYLAGDKIIAIAREAGAEAIHPGYGFLAENVPFACAVRDAGLTFIGPSPEAMARMGDKVAARQAVMPLGVPVVPGTDGPVESTDGALAFAAQAGYPVAVKAAGGGGGRGIRVVRAPEEMETALTSARREAEAYFKNPEVYLERYFPDPRHIEIQVLGDSTGRLVHLGERDCSTQRRHQKMIEEAPSPAVDRELRAHIGDAAVRAARSVGYTSAGTVEFLLTREGAFYFLEMNTRIQVEHGVTERVTGIDLIREMILIAAGRPMTVQDSILDLNGHAIEVRVNAENPLDNFRPTPGPILRYREPGGIGVRLDAGVYAGYTVPGDYDSLMAKLITWAPDREQCRRRMLRALGEYDVAGPATTIPFAAAVLRTPTFTEGEMGTTFVERHLDELKAAVAPSAEDREVPAAAGPERTEPRTFEVEVDRRRFTVKVAEVRTGEKQRPVKRARAGRSAPRTNAVVSPMHGAVVSIRRDVGAAVEAGDVLFVIEAMKMENEIAAHRAGTLKSIDVQVGDTVQTGQQLATID